MNDVSGIARPGMANSMIGGSSRLTSQARISLEGVQPAEGANSTMEMVELKQFADELDQIQRGLTWMQEIRHSLERALQNLSS